MRVSDIVVGHFLHQLEYEADIFVIDRKIDRLHQIEIFAMRSDRFPEGWEGKEVRGVRHCDVRGVQIELCVPAPPDPVAIAAIERLFGKFQAKSEAIPHPQKETAPLEAKQEEDRGSQEMS